MNKPLLGSLVAATLLLGDASAATMYERFETMEKEMLRLQTELADMKAKEAAAEPEEEKADYSEAEPEEEEDEEDEDEDSVADRLDDLEESVHEINTHTAGNNLKLNVDFRTSFDNLQYKMSDGSKQKNDAVLSNRLWINMNWAANKNVSFTGQLAYNKTYGQRFGASNPVNGSFENFDWITNENAYDNQIRVKSAYYFYRNDTFLGSDIPWTFSLGRRPSTNGHLINLRDDDVAASPSGHTINVEFDGLSSKFSLEQLTGVEGMYVKFCAGRGATNAAPRFNSAPYAEADTDLAAIDLAGLIFVPYDNGQFSVGTQFYTATNLIEAVNPADQTAGFSTVGNIYSGSMYMMMNGIGDEWSDFLDDTTFFVSGAMSRTDPDEANAAGMFGSTDMENGYSYWAGLNMPSLFSEDGRFGLEFNHGSKYWRSITYAEDTMIGSKVAARGDAYEAYFTEPLVDDVLSLQVRYTYIDYDYSGSNGFFGSTTGMPMKIEDTPSPGIVDKAQDIRVYLRYRY